MDTDHAVPSAPATRPGPATPSSSPGLRASDAEREEVARLLRAAMTEGRLTLAEGEHLLGSAYAARFRDELTPLTAELPDGGRRDLAHSPQARAEVRRDLRRHAAVVLLVAVLLTGLWALSDARFFWPAIPLTFLVLGLARHARFGRYRLAYSYRHQLGSRPERHWRHLPRS